MHRSPTEKGGFLVYSYYMSQILDDKLNQLSKPERQLWAMRHSAEHVLTQAMIRLYGKELKMAMGPATAEGFYFDFDYPGKIGPEDFSKIEAEMKKIIKQNLPFKKEVVSIKKARQLFKNNPYKQEWLDEIKAKKQKATLYWTGDEFVDLCAGPHVESTGQIGSFKLLKVAGAYWRGDEKNKMLTRIYGTAFTSQKKLDQHLENLKETAKRNHRRLGKKLGLFAIFPEIGPGLPVWLHKGYIIRRVLEDYMLDLERQYGYVHILTPHIHRDKLFKISGHLDFYKESMYAPIKIDQETYYLKPMNCPAGMLVYKMKPRSYKDLPIKMGELGTVYRYEKSGELHGLQRVRGFTQNDAHIFCTKKQLAGQLKEVMQLLRIFYRDLGFDNYTFTLAISDPKDEKYKFCGQRKDWLWAEKALRKVLVESKVKFSEAVGEAAFYGPKIDVEAINVFGKKDAISTIQIDFNLPERFKLSYINAQGEKQTPLVIHRALVGSFERFFAFLIEYYGGAFPAWLAPVQAKVIPIADRHHAYATKVAQALSRAKLRVEIDKDNLSMQKRIRRAELNKIPYIIIVGDREIKSKSVNLRCRGQKQPQTISLKKLLQLIQKQVQQKIAS
jgi:threonyl-tRNA synthetase